MIESWRKASSEVDNMRRIRSSLFLACRIWKGESDILAKDARREVASMNALSFCSAGDEGGKERLHASVQSFQLLDNTEAHHS